MLVAVPVGVSPTGGDCPDATVVIPGVGKGNQPDGSPGVKASVGRGNPGRIRQGRRATRQVVAVQTSVASKCHTHRRRMVGVLGSAELFTRGRRPMSSAKNCVGAAAYRTLRSLSLSMSEPKKSRQQICHSWLSLLAVRQRSTSSIPHIDVGTADGSLTAPQGR